MVSASRLASRSSFSASRSAPASLLEARLRRIRYPATTPTASPTTMYTAIIISVLSLHRSRGTKKAGQRARPVPHSLVQEIRSVSYTHLRAHETRHDLVCRLL